MGLRQRFISLFGGVFSGLLGVGGAIVFIPLMTLLFRQDQKTAQGTALLIMSVISLVGFATYSRSVTYEFSSFAILLSGGIVGTFVGNLLVNHVSSDLLKKFFSIYLIIAAVRMFLL